jgi:hypothetical protein
MPVSNGQFMAITLVDFSAAFDTATTLLSLKNFLQFTGHYTHLLFLWTSGHFLLGFSYLIFCNLFQAHELELSP